MVTRKEKKAAYDHARVAAKREQKAVYDKEYGKLHRSEKNAYALEWYRKHPEEVRNTRLMRTFKLTASEWDVKLAAQDRKCAICKTDCPQDAAHGILITIMLAAQA